ncbi:MAG TPA: hypothetical protein PLD20_27440 [Blastocatellia bacterium]|nr:hypothetical protein [Blastocatellia bacterium]HMY73251.1 hypothetical protein [Blastocatellia bacterium]HMZ21696.1 hypothetical protein [Blastocatellia bacterium]HNG28910.1 hypothetical protein [Blastocatellia bacterium]
MNSTEQEEFFVGYLSKAPQGIAGVARRAVIGLLAVAVIIAMALVFGQHRFADGVFEFGNVREFEGELIEKPFPQLLVRREKTDAMALPFVSYGLVGEGKHGAAADTAGFGGRRVKLRGTLIHRDGTAMIEVVGGSVAMVAVADSAASLAVETLSTQTLTGEIVDSKCYLGVMNPGHTKPHRECASLCIRGGIPPLFVVKDAEGRSVHLWLVSETGEPVNQQVLDFVAEPIRITGQVKRSGDQLYFYANPKLFHH